MGIVDGLGDRLLNPMPLVILYSKSRERGSGLLAFIGVWGV